MHTTQPDMQHPSGSNKLSQVVTQAVTSCHTICHKLSHAGVKNVSHAAAHKLRHALQQRVLDRLITSKNAQKRRLHRIQARALGHAAAPS